jgi:hypothetical protein
MLISDDNGDNGDNGDDDNDDDNGDDDDDDDDDNGDDYSGCGRDDDGVMEYFVRAGRTLVTLDTTPNICVWFLTLVRCQSRFCHHARLSNETLIVILIFLLGLDSRRNQAVGT